MENRFSLPARVGLVLLSIWALTPIVCLAGVGDLDPTFGTGGLVTTDFGSSFDNADGVAIQADGKIVVAGGTTSDAALARYNPDGSLDPAFGNGGLVTTSFPSDHDFEDGEWYAVGIQVDGKIVAAGLAIPWIESRRDFTVARYNPDGSLDPSFGIGGIVTTPSPSNADQVSSLVIQPDGKIVVAGLLFVGTSRDFALRRYLPDGNLDPGFGVDGLVTTDFRGGDDRVLGLAIQADGKLVAVGSAVGSSYLDLPDFAVARYNPDGTLDESFGTGGRVTTDLASSADISTGVVVQADGKIVVGGQAYVSGSGYHFALARYSPLGSLDGSFGTNGLAVSSLPSPGGAATAIALQGDGRIVLVGYAPSSETNYQDLDFAVARYETDGSLDASFGSNGVVTTDFAGTGSRDTADAVALQPDGMIVVAGTTYPPGAPFDFALARYEVATRPEEQIEDLTDLVQSFDLPSGIENSFVVKLDAALAALAAGDTATACGDLGAFINHAHAQAGKKLTTEEASQLIAAAGEIRALLGCP